MELYDQKLYRYVMNLRVQCIFQASHDRKVEFYNDRLDRSSPGELFDLVGWVTLLVEFTHARKIQLVTVQLGWLQVYFADLPAPM